jgi:Xaa-Pro aminopeptidase
MYLLFQSLRPRTPFRDVTPVIDDVRMVSSPEEIAYIREACRIAASGLNTVLELMQPGVEETYLSTQARVAMDREAGAKSPVSTRCYMQQGERSLECHAASTGNAIRAGQIVEVVCECEVVYYQGAVERCLLIGDASPEVERAYAVMLKAFEAALNAVRPGVSFAEVDRVARRVLIDAGYDRITNGSGLIRNIVHHTGGRIAAGDLRVYNERTLQPGMVLSVEPWALIPGVGGPRHCELVVVTADGAQPLTGVDRGVLRIATAASSNA